MKNDDTTKVKLFATVLNGNDTVRACSVHTPHVDSRRWHASTRVNVRRVVQCRPLSRRLEPQKS